MAGLLPADEVRARTAGGEWRLEGDAIARDLQFEDFAAAIAFVNRAADTAEAANHHPDILVHGWNRVRLTLSTHSAGGVTESDLAMAASLDTLVSD